MLGLSLQGLRLQVFVIPVCAPTVVDLHAGAGCTPRPSTAEVFILTSCHLSCDWFGRDDDVHVFSTSGCAVDCYLSAIASFCVL